MMTLAATCAHVALLLIPLATCLLIPLEPEQVVYGKYYFPNGNGTKDRLDNSYVLFKQGSANISYRFPAVLHFLGNAYVRQSPFTTRLQIPAAATYNQIGITFISVGYRAILRHAISFGASFDLSTYYYDEDGVAKAEELVHVDASGALALDTRGLTMKDYKVRACWLELITKCMYDSVQALEHLIANADQHALDPHRIFFLSSSAGVPQANYLIWVYHKWNVHRFTPIGAVFENPTFDMPEWCLMSQSLRTYIDHSDLGPKLPLSQIVPLASCSFFWGNPGCGATNDGPYKCNKSWQALLTTHFCQPAEYSMLTVGQLYQTQRWNNFDSEVGLGMEKLWYVSRNMLDHQPRPFYLWVKSFSPPMPISWPAHDPLNVFCYGEMAERLGLNYTAVYTGQPGLRKTDVASYAAKAPVPVNDVWGLLFMRSSMHWPPEDQNHICYIAHAFGIQVGANALTALAPCSVLARTLVHDQSWSPLVLFLCFIICATCGSMLIYLAYCHCCYHEVDRYHEVDLDSDPPSSDDE